MGQAKQRGTFEERKAQAIKEGRYREKKQNKRGWIRNLLRGHGATENAITLALMAHTAYKRRYGNG